MKINKREFLSDDPADLDTVGYTISADGTTYPDCDFKISDGSNIIYYSLNAYGDRADLDESLGRLVRLKKTLSEYIELVRDNQDEILKSGRD